MQPLDAFLNGVVSRISPTLYVRIGWHRDKELLANRIVDLCVRRGDTVADVGAHFGYYTDRLARLVGDEGHVQVFEPNPAMWPRLEFLNRRRNVTVYRFALSDRNRTAELHIPSVGGSSVEALATLDSQRPRTTEQGVCRRARGRKPLSKSKRRPGPREMSLARVIRDERHASEARVLEHGGAVHGARSQLDAGGCQMRPTRQGAGRREASRFVSASEPRFSWPRTTTTASCFARLASLVAVEARRGREPPGRTSGRMAT